MRWNDRSEWVWSTDRTHEPLVSPEVFARAQEVARAGMHRPTEAKRRTTKTGRRFVLSGLVVCGLCGRRMVGHFAHGTSYYRCRFAAEYALAEHIDHPKTVHLREEAVVPELDRWLAQAFAPSNLDHTCELLAATSAVDEATEARLEAARRKLHDCEARLTKYRATLDAGGDPDVVAEWIRQVQGERLAAERELARVSPATPLTKAEVRKLVKGARHMTKVLAQADPELKAQVYADLGIRLEYRPEERIVGVEVPLGACATARVGEET